MTIWLTIAAMAAVTFVLRALPLVTMGGELPGWLRRWLSYVPVAIFTALVLPPLLVAGDPSRLVVGAPLLAGLAGAVVAYTTRSVLLTILAGMVLYWLLQNY